MIVVATFNIQNDRIYSEEKINSILNFINKYNIDILNLQELSKYIDKSLINQLNNINYNNYGKYRFHIPLIFKKINERCPIITKYQVIKKKTYNLPFLPSLLRRVLTKEIVIIEGKEVSIYNTHIDYLSEIAKRRQLKKILKIISKDKNPSILTGDFNLKNIHTPFKEFKSKLKEKGIIHYDIKEKTWKNSKYHRAIDHIFISSEFKLIEKKLITEIPISDHYPVLIKIKWKEEK